MFRIFKDWRECRQDPVPSLVLNRSYFYYLHAQAWHLKGYLGGTHSYCAFYHDHNWMVVELTDIETLTVQRAKIIYKGTDTHAHAPFISTRPYNARWFGHRPKIVDYCHSIDYDKIINAVESYPIKKFRLLETNCNTFVSYLIAALNLNLRRPIRSVGFKNKYWWRDHYGIKV